MYKITPLLKRIIIIIQTHQLQTALPQFLASFFIQGFFGGFFYCAFSIIQSCFVCAVLLHCAVNRRLRTLMRVLGKNAVNGGHSPLDHARIRLSQVSNQFRVNHAWMEAVGCHTLYVSS